MERKFKLDVEDVFYVLSSPLKVKILKLLNGKTLETSKIVAEISKEEKLIFQAIVEQELEVLYNFGFLEKRVCEKEVSYSLSFLGKYCVEEVERVNSFLEEYYMDFEELLEEIAEELDKLMGDEL